MQIRQNATEVQEYMNDLFKWEDEQRNAEAKRKRVANPKKAKEVPIRGRAPGEIEEASTSKASPAPQLVRQVPQARTSPKRRANTSTKSGKKESAASHTYDKSKWESFDVDAALKEASDSDSEAVEPVPSAPEPIETLRPRVNGTKSLKPAAPQAAIRQPPAPEPECDSEGWKNKGNAHFRKGDFEQAKECYSQSIALSPSSIGFGNRAMAFLKLGLNEQAIEDCSESIKLDPRYLKAYQRRGTAYR